MAPQANAFELGPNLESLLCDVMEISVAVTNRRKQANISSFFIIGIVLSGMDR